MIPDNILKERERNKAIITSYIDKLIENREENIKSRKKRNISMLKAIKEDLLFKIDNPNYVRIKDRK